MDGNELSGIVLGPVVQAREVRGGIHFTEVVAAQAPDPLYRALVAATVEISTGWGVGRGVRIASDLVLTSASLVNGGEGLARVPAGPEGDGYACLSGGVPVERSRLVVEKVVGAPVLNWLTGCVCGVFGPSGEVIPLPDLPDAERLERSNHRWLDLLDADQLAAAGRRHPGRSLRRYLEAVRTADQDHQYEWVRRSAPPLADIYLRRQAMRQPGGQEDDRDEPERVNAEELVARHTDAQVVAEPGAGKSSLVRHVAAAAAARWLDEGVGDFVPVPVAAKALVHDLPLPDALADGVLPGLSHRLGRDELAELLRSEPIAGVPWLVLVDGLDEVVDVGARAAVTRQVRDHRRHGTHRFLVTSRPLNQHELRPLVDRRTSPTYVLQLFSDPELTEFARTWLTADGHPSPKAGADELLAKVRSTKLHDLAHVPLIATMLCILHGEGMLDPPSDQTQLYERFVRWHLAKVNQSKALVDLRARHASRGSDVLRAIDHLVVNLEHLLQDVSNSRLLDKDPAALLDLAVRWAGPAVGSGPLEQDWVDIVADVLRLSGLLVQQGERFVHRHQTIEEFLAASHLAREHPDPATSAARRLLAPHREWPWPDLEVKVFLAARWIGDDRSLRRPLRRLLRWHNREQNIGFLAALVRHGVELPDGIDAAAVRILGRLLVKRPPDRSWQLWAQWLKDLSRPAAIAVLHGIVADRSQDEYRRYEAARFLHGFAPDEGLDAATIFVSAVEVGQLARFALGRAIHESDPAMGIALFVDLAESGQDSVLAAQAIDFVTTHDPHVAVELHARIVADDSYTDYRRLAAARAAVRVGTRRGIDLMCVLIGSVESAPARAEAIAAVRAADEPRLVALLETVARDGRRKYVARFEAAWYLFEQMRHDHQLLTSLVEPRGFPAEMRVRAALTIPNSTRGADIIEDVIESFGADVTKQLWAIEQLCRASFPAASRHYKRLVRDGDQRDETRLQAVTSGSKYMSTDELVGLYKVLVDTAADDATRLVAAEKAAAVSPGDGRKLVTGLATSESVRTTIRVQAAASMARRSSDEGFTAYASIARSSRVPVDTRVSAYRKARGLKSSRADALLRQLVQGDLPAQTKLVLIKDLGTSDACSALARLIDDRDVSPQVRWDATQALLARDPKRGNAAMRALAGDGNAPGWLRRQARAVVDGG
ncbi:NACHT domain-containing protein [Umezawaea sp. NPDC059074]|uniref:NACHT domain-containing protein n=1 Tax=Umezawaea sp. NPDC059074 TaxID=3346716 RepID=UPI0036B060D3